MATKRRRAKRPIPVGSNAAVRAPGAADSASRLRAAQVPTPPSGDASTGPLQRLQRGELDARGYGAAIVDDALRPLGKMHGDDRAFIRAALEAALGVAAPAGGLYAQVVGARRPATP
jgi:hypothetical protein